MLNSFYFSNQISSFVYVCHSFKILKKKRCLSVKHHASDNRMWELASACLLGHRTHFNKQTLEILKELLSPGTDVSNRLSQQECVPVGCVLPTC